MKRLKVISEKCSGCRICQLMCSMIHGEGAFNPKRALLRVEINRRPGIDTAISDIDKPIPCLQCEPAPCAESCPEDAFQWDEALEIWKINHDLCTACGACVDVCPYDVIVMSDDMAMKCDLCLGDPTCVQYCPTGALDIHIT